MKKHTKAFILASQSKARLTMLENCGVSCETWPADLPEKALLEACKAKNYTPENIALYLAEEKAKASAYRYFSERKPVAGEETTAYFIASDQLLICGEEILSKSKNMEEAKKCLRFLSGKTHQLLSAAVVYKASIQLDDITSDNQPTLSLEKIFTAHDSASLHMRSLSDAQIETYLEKAGPEILYSVGCYQLEALGSWLFKAIHGDYFTILGMPLLALLQGLREHNLYDELR